jgi:adenylosuccinate synthase
VLGVVKAYTTRVGNGPFPTELFDDVGEVLQQQGNEFGATTGRKRRCGWFDSVVARYAVRINGIQTLALTKLDVLDALPTVKVCTGYRWKGEVFTEFPYDPRIITAGEPVYKELKGWQAKSGGCIEYALLPREAKEYIRFLEDILETPMSLISTGSDRDTTIWVQGSPLEDWIARK